METPFFSIIVPVYNAGEKLPSALDSIVKQTFTDYEIIVIDGLSTDDTLDIVKKYSYERKDIKFISERDEGTYDAMNKGMSMASGQWLYFLGSDDILHSNIILSTIAKHIVSTKARVVYGNVRIVGNSSWAKDGDIYDGSFDFEKLLNKNICHQAIFYNSKFVKTEIGKYNIGYKLCADWDFNLRCFAKTDFLFVPVIVADFHAGGITTILEEDTIFSREFVGNIIRYFKISAFSRYLNHKGFNWYHDVLLIQKHENYFKYLLNRLKGKFLWST